MQTDSNARQLNLTANRHFYVSVIDPGTSRKGFLLGPYDDEGEAVANLARGRRLACEHDVRADFYAYGTASSPTPLKTVFGR